MKNFLFWNTINSIFSPLVRRGICFLPLYTHFAQMQLVEKSHLKPEGYSSSTTVKAEKGKSA